VERGGLTDVVIVVKLQQDIVLMDKQHDFVSGYCPAFVDCSSFRGTPVLAESEICEKYLAEFRNMVKFIKQADKSQIIVDIDSRCRDLCLTTIFGLFLQYPFVYYTSDTGNCLSGVELTLVELGSRKNDSGSYHVTEHVHTSFSVPTALCPNEAEFTSLPYYLSHRGVCLDSVAM